MTARLKPDRPSIPLPDRFMENTQLLPNNLAEAQGKENPHPYVGGHLSRSGVSGYIRDPHDPRQEREDRELVRLGILDELSYREARKCKANPVQVAVFNGDRLYQMIWRHNLRTTAGTIWMAYLLNGGGYGSSNGFGLHTTFAAAAASASGTPTITGPAGFAPTANQYVGHIASMGNSYGYIVNHTTGANALVTLDRWYDMTVTTGAAIGTYPTAGQCNILPGQSPAYWMALTNDSAAVQTQDTALTAEISINGLQRANGRCTVAWGAGYPPAPGTGGTTQQGQYTLQVLWTSTTSDVAFQKGGILTAENGGILPWESLLAATTLHGANGDQAQVTWTVNY